MVRLNSKLLIICFTLIHRIVPVITSVEPLEEIEVGALHAEPPVDNVDSLSTPSRCSLDCFNGGICVNKKTMRTTENPVARDIEGEFECQCTEDFTGPYCEVDRRRLDTTNCGAMQCL